MPTLNDFAQQVSGQLNLPFDHSLNERIKDRLIAIRAKLIRQNLEKNGTDYYIKQTFNFELEKVDDNKGCIGTSNCKILRSKNKIPRPIRMKSSSPFLYVGKPGGDFPFTYMTPIEIKLFFKSKFATDIIPYDYTDNYIWIYKILSIKTASITHYFEDPDAVITFCNNECNKDDVEFLLPADIGFDIVKIITDEFRVRPESFITPIDDKAQKPG